MDLGGGDRGGAGVPVEGGDGALLCCEVLETILFWCHLVPTLELRHLDLPLPGGGGGAGVDVNVDLVAAGRGRDEHVLSSVIPADHRWGGSTRVGHCKGVVDTISNFRTVRRSSCSSVRSLQDHGVEINPDFTNI